MVVCMNIGHFYLELLTFQVQNFLQNSESIPEVVSHKAFIFPQLRDKVPWPEIKDFEKTEDALEIQALSLKYFKRALNYMEDRKVNPE